MPKFYDAKSDYVNGINAVAGGGYAAPGLKQSIIQASDFFSLMACARTLWIAFRPDI
jgi:hypothetical protein